MYRDNIGSLDDRIAGFWRRVFAYTTDLIIIQALYVILLVIGYIAVSFGIKDTNTFFSFDLVIRLAISFFLIYFPLFIVYFTTFCFMGGQTPGKMIFRIKVVSRDGCDITLGSSIVRSLGYFASSLFFGMGFLIALLNRRRRTLHDLLSGSYVISTRYHFPFINHNEGVGDRGHGTILAASLLLSFLIIFPVRLSSGEIVDRVIAVVNNEVISLSDLKRYISFYSISKKGVGLDDARREALQGLIDERLILTEASRFGMEEPSEEAIKEEIKKLEEGDGTEGPDEKLSWQGLEPDDLYLLSRNRLIIERFIDQRINLFILISPEDIDNYLRTNKQKFVGISQKEARLKIGRILTEERSTEKIRELKARLRAKAVIRIISEG